MWGGGYWEFGNRKQILKISEIFKDLKVLFQKVFDNIREQKNSGPPLGLRKILTFWYMCLCLNEVFTTKIMLSHFQTGIDSLSMFYSLRMCQGVSKRVIY